MTKFIFIYVLTLIFIFVDHYKYWRADSELPEPTFKDVFKVHWSLYIPVVNTIIVVFILFIDLLWKILKKD